MSVTQTVVREFETDLVVATVDQAAHDVIAVTLAHPEGEALPEWTPGAHVDLILGEGLIRQYSLCGRTNERNSWRVAVLKTPTSRGGSNAVHELCAGATIRVRGPRNHFPVVAAKKYVFIAGGIGITPLLAMIFEAEAAGAEWELHYAGRTRASMAFLDELAPYGDRVHLLPADEHGRLDLDAILGTPQADTLVYTCGPESLLAAVEERCVDWPVGSLHLERFSAKTTTALVTEKSFEVVLQRSGKTLQVPAERSVFDTVREAGVSVLGSCLEGVCGTCETRVIDGDVDHRDSILDDEERASNEYMMICVSRCRSSQLTLDL